MQTITDRPTDEDTMLVLPWHDPIVDSIGHDVRGTYVELFWLNVLGPTATWALRRLVNGLEQFPLGYELDLHETAASLGLSYSPGTSNTFAKALNRCTLFGTIQPVAEGIAVRRRLPPVAQRHLMRMPDVLREQHAHWVVRACTYDDVQRAHALAAAMVATGDSSDDVERHLLAVGIPPAAALAAVAALSPPTAA